MNHSEIIIYQDQHGKIRIDVHMEDETVWLTQEHMAQLFQIHPEDPQPRLISQAVDIIHSGGVIIYPTDSG